MKSLIKKGCLVILAAAVLNSAAFSQVEFTFFGLYHLNISYPSDGEFNSRFGSIISNWDPEWQAFFETVLEEKNGMGFGGRAAYNLTPTTGFEVSVEYIMAETAFTEGLVDDLLNDLESSGSLDWLKTANRSGGNIVRYYGNLVFNFTESTRFTPYATAGLGITQFKIKQGQGPEIEVVSPGLGERFHLYYADSSALTFNGGLGVKALFSPNFGVRADARIFVCDLDFEQMLSVDIGGSRLIDNEGSFIQSGTHIDTNINIGLFVKF